VSVMHTVPGTRAASGNASPFFLHSITHSLSSEGRNPDARGTSCANVRWALGLNFPGSGPRVTLMGFCA
jgi:hypothetical protein